MGFATRSPPSVVPFTPKGLHDLILSDSHLVQKNEVILRDVSQQNSPWSESAALPPCVTQKRAQISP
jgi:hypothetical protein